MFISKSELMQEKKDYTFTIEELELLSGMIDGDYPDRMDASPAETILNYRFIRNPETDDTIFALHYPYTDTIVFYLTEITMEDITEMLEEQEEGFYTFIGRTKEDSLEDLDNYCLSDIAFSLDQYSGCFSEMLAEGYPDTSLTIEELINLFEKGEI